MSEPVQNYKNHTRFAPAFHFVAVPILLLNVIVTVKNAVHAPAGASILAAATALALLMVAFLARLFALTAQDRVIRLEERLRLKELWPAALHPRIAEFSTRQLVAMRFASDRELPDLAQAVLRDGITDQKRIKLMIKDWKGDYQRV